MLQTIETSLANTPESRFGLRYSHKGKLNRQAYLLSNSIEMLSCGLDEYNGPDSDLIFPSRNGKVMDAVSNIFPQIVKLMFNEGITDKRLRVYFHTLRHTFASWLVQRGMNLYSVKGLMGHEDFKMIKRYSHLSPMG